MNDNNYKIDLNKLSPSLVKYFDETSNNIERMEMPNDWTPPIEYGLKNSDKIIPQYYFNKYQSVFQINYYNMIIDDIRNMRTLNKNQLEYIKRLNNDKKQKLFEEFNNVLVVINQIYCDDKLK